MSRVVFFFIIYLLSVKRLSGNIVEKLRRVCGPEKGRLQNPHTGEGVLTHTVMPRV